jgi:hypothetical protein
MPTAGVLKTADVDAKKGFNFLRFLNVFIQVSNNSVYDMTLNNILHLCSGLHISGESVHGDAKTSVSVQSTFRQQYYRGTYTELSWAQNL